MRERCRSIGRGTATVTLMLLGLGYACSRSAPASQQTPTMTTAVVSPGGGTVELGGVGTATFPAGAFRSPRQVTLSATSSLVTQHLHVRLGQWVPFTQSAPWELRINSGDAAPETPVTISLVVPSEFLDSLPPDYKPGVFAQLVQASEMDLIDSFVFIFPAVFDSSSNRISAELRANVFTDQRTPDGTFEAIVVVGFCCPAVISEVPQRMTDTSEGASPPTA